VKKNLSVVLETSTLSAVELSEYCRVKGRYPEQIKPGNKLVSQATQQSRVKE
jgi:hypothetical protein